jgi:hypothetical protein
MAKHMTRIDLWILLAGALACGCLPAAQDVQCLEDANCNRFAGGACRLALSGHHWCSYPDPGCPSGYRYSDLDVGDGVSGECAAITHDLSISVEGDGAGIVSSLPGDLVCSAGTCTGAFLEGTRVELAADARSGGFLGWSQACQGPGACSAVMDRDRSVTALFGTPGHGRWVRQIGGAGWEYGSGVTTDGDGNLIAVGLFSDSLQIGATTLISAGNYDVFVVKVNGLTGNVIWAKRFGGLEYEGGNAVRTDASNNIYVTGSFAGSVDFGGGELQAAGTKDMFVLKLTAAGGHVWSRQFGGVEREFGDSLAVRDNAIAVVGTRSQPAAIGGSILPDFGANYTDIYIVMVTTDGEFVWSKSMGGPSWDSALGVALDSSGNVVVSGKFAGTVDFGGSLLTSATSNSDVFVAKYAGSTGAHLFSRRYGGTEEDRGSSVAVDAMDNIVVTGFFGGIADFGGPVALVAVNTDAFVAKYTLAGAYLWAKSFGARGATSPGIAIARSVALDPAGDVVLTGQFCGTISFGGAEISSAGVCSAGAEDIFAVRLAGADGGHLNSVRAGSRAEAPHITVTANGSLNLVGHFDGFAELGSHGLTSVNGDDAFILALSPL